MDWKQLRKAIKSPSLLSRYKEAIRQDFSNPTRLGMALGAGLAPIVAMGAAQLGLMNNGFVMAGIGSIESLVAGLTMRAAHGLSEWKFQLSLAEQVGL